MDARALSRGSIAHHSKSFALASRLLPAEVRDDVAVLYAWCRRCDDAVDLAPEDARPEALRALQDELDAVFSARVPGDVLLAAFQELCRRREIPREYPSELVAGMEMDVLGFRYETRDELLLYCHRVAGVVGLMMCHVLGLSDEKALRNAVHLGIAMQLTNICRDVAEDWERGRLYLPAEMMRAAGARISGIQGPVPEALRVPASVVVRELLDEADVFYRSAEAGVPHLPFRASLAVTAARAIYARIGAHLRARGCDVTRGRAVVPTWEKLVLLAWSVLARVVENPLGAWRFRAVPVRTTLRFPADVIEPRGTPRLEAALHPPR